MPTEINLVIGPTGAGAQSFTRSFSETEALTDSANVAHTPAPPGVMMGCSTSPNDHGGTEVWDGWRTYNQSTLLTYSNRTGNQRPKFMAYSKDGPNLGGATPNYTTVFNEVLTDLNNYYYTTQTGQTRTARWGIKLYWSNGNENYDKGAITLPHSTAKINNYVTSQQALYDAVHYVDPSTNQRRFPDAYAGSNPTHNHEFDGIIQGPLHASAPYHDFVMWSMYPPGRQPNGTPTAADPTYNWPSFVESQRTINPQGFLIRCFYRTKQAEALAGHSLLISVGEIGIGDDPNDNTTRPYYAVHGLIEGFLRLGEQYSLQMPFACWWDNQSTTTSSQNVLTDEDPASNPSTRVAWQNWAQYNHYRGGSHPAAWAGNPKAGWQDTGTPL